MSDFLLENPQARKLIQTLGLPIPVPQRLKRARGPYEARPLDGQQVIVGAAVQGASALSETLAQSLVRMGAEPLVVAAEDDTADMQPFERAGEGWGRPVGRLSPNQAPQERVHALVLDATGVDSIEGLNALYDFFHPLMRSVAKCGRVVVIGRPASRCPATPSTPVSAAISASLEGFTRSVAKEIGGKGSTAISVFVEPGAEDRLDATLRFVLSPRSAFVSCQPIHLNSRASSSLAPDAVPTTCVLEGKVALITGAARGIGASTAELMAAEGAHVVCLDRPADDGPVSKIARRIGGSVLLTDVTDPDAPAKIAQTLKERHGGVDIVVHNAGITRDKTLANMKPSVWGLTLDVNLGAIVRMTDALLDENVLHDDGRIVCLSSVSGIAGNRGQSNYSASKAGVVGYVQSLAGPLSDRGITVNAIAPGFIETRLTAAMPVPIREAARRLSALGQGGKPEDVGQAITFLATPGAVGVTGRVLRVCGGALIGA